MTLPPAGLSTQQAEELQLKYGLNEIPQKETPLLLTLFSRFFSPISLMLLAATLLSFVTGKIFDGWFIIFLLIINQTVTFWQEHKADQAIKKLNLHLATTIRVLRDDLWQTLDTKNLVAGDLIEVTGGDIIPADGKIFDCENITINESALTGESLPKDKRVNDLVYSGSFVITGMAKVRITATGALTYFGKTLLSIERSRKKSLLEKDVLTISKFLTALSLIAVAILTIVLLFNHTPIAELLTLDISLVIAGIPISLPTVMTLIIEIGVVELAKKQTIVRRLSALEDLANVTLLLTDKTGTLTLNKIEVQNVASFNKVPARKVMTLALLCSQVDPQTPINQAVISYAVDQNLACQGYQIIKKIPADSIRKRTTVVVKKNTTVMTVTTGAPQIILSLCSTNIKTRAMFLSHISLWAEKGFRTIAVAYKQGNHSEEKMKLAGILALSDSLRPEAGKMITFLQDEGVEVVMVTGDNKAIATHIANKLNLGKQSVVTKQELEGNHWQQVNNDFFRQTASVAEILPDDKYRLVKEAKKQFIVASTGDGVNDLPAIKEAHVGIAVSNAVDALKAAADLVLLSPGISVVKNALLESRKIFARIYAYSVYRISESLRLIITVAVLGIWYHEYPLTPLQLILIALLNDIPIISLAFDRVKLISHPSMINVKKRFITSSVFGLVGVCNSLFLFIFLTSVIHASWPVIQTLYFLKLTIGGHLLVYVARTREWWFKFLPSKVVIIATSTTQLVATILALKGWLMPAKLSLVWIIFIWAWAFIWMQVSELTKHLKIKHIFVS